MKTITIKHFRTGQTLFAGRFTDTRQAVERAVADGISLAFADLRHANLVNALMDGAILDSAQFDEANLMGANLSEATLRRASFVNAQLHSTVLCEAILDAAHFKGTLFGGTDISGALVKRCLFDTLSALSLNFRDARHIDTNGFAAINDYICEFSRPPRVLTGLPFHIACFDHSLLIGNHAVTHIPVTKGPGISSSLFSFITGHRNLIETLWQGCPKDDARVA